jgi:hypothetical protein
VSPPCRIYAIEYFRNEKALKGKSESPWSLHIRSFWKIINTPEEQGKLLLLQNDEMAEG